MAYTISRKSWHFRLYSFYIKRVSPRKRSWLPDAICLCPYMRTLLIWLPLCSILFLGAVSLGLTVIYAVISAIIELSTVAGWILAAEVIGGIALVIGAIVGGVYTGCVVKQKIDDYRFDHRQPTTLVGQHLKSIHEKICPCFEITE